MKVKTPTENKTLRRNKRRKERRRQTKKDENLSQILNLERKLQIREKEKEIRLIFNYHISLANFQIDSSIAFHFFLFSTTDNESPNTYQQSRGANVTQLIKKKKKRKR